MKKAFFAFLVLFFLLFSPKTALAQSGNFSTDYNVVYTVSNSANTRVNINATLTNLSDKYYASSYSVQVGFTDIKNLTASDSEGSISPKILKGNKGTSIVLEFNKNVVGLNNKLNFTISFDTSEVAQNFNNVWDINVPGVSEENDFSEFNVTVNYPSFLGKPTFVKPALQKQFTSSNSSQLFFSKEDLGGAGISLAFGTFQVYDIDLKYHIQNVNVFPISTEIALPPSTNYQEVAIDDINPRPENVRTDKDGNWLAKYILGASQNITVNVTGKVKVLLNPKQETLDAAHLKDYLKSESYWAYDNKRIKDLANELKTPYAIYQYVTKTLSYDFSRVETSSPRLGALEALNNPNSAVCLEFTDLFIAIARAAGIPAREVDGYGYTSNLNERPLSQVKDILHAWPEYYDFDKKTWIMIDPTWGNTTGGVDYFNTLDFDHIAFIIKGEKSDYPVPAGGYKLPNQKDTKDVDVKIGKSYDAVDGKLNTDLSISNTLIAGLPIDGKVIITNTGKTLIPVKEVNVTTSLLSPKNQTIFTESIPPFGHQDIILSFNRTPILTNGKDTIKITLDNITISKNVQILPFFVSRVFILGGLLIVNIAIVIFLVAYLYRRISIFRQKK